jgi:hypothetical protein
MAIMVMSFGDEEKEKHALELDLQGVVFEPCCKPLVMVRIIFVVRHHVITLILIFRGIHRPRGPIMAGLVLPQYTSVFAILVICAALGTAFGALFHIHVNKREAFYNARASAQAAAVQAAAEARQRALMPTPQASAQAAAAQAAAEARQSAFMPTLGLSSQSAFMGPTQQGSGSGSWMRAFAPKRR